jgi:glycosyltransferase involved in cell wall biosynthesis
MVAYYTHKLPVAFQGIKNSVQRLGDKQQGILIHDLYVLSSEVQMGFWQRYQEKNWLKKLFNDTNEIFVFTAFTKKEIHNAFPSVKAPINILPVPYNQELVPTDEDARDIIRYQFTQGDAYFLCTLPIHDAAHIIPLLKGFSQFKKRTNSNMKLVFTGIKGEFSKAVLLTIDTYKYRNDLFFLEQVNEKEQYDLLCSAYALVHPCRWERFGHSILDALKAGVAVLTAEESSMSEIAGMAGMYFDEKNGSDIGDRLIRIYNDEQMRTEMIGTGLCRFR